MNLERNIKKILGKKGTYILEASLIIPPFVLVMVLLISVISVIGSAEKSLFVMGEEMRLVGIKAAFIEDPVTTPLVVQTRVSKDSDLVDGVWINDYGYLYEDRGIEDLLSISVRLNYAGVNPLGRLNLLKVEQRVMCRAFTGLTRDGSHGENALSGYDESHIVYVFPKRGERYHKRSCPFLNPACEKVFLTGDIKWKFKSCLNCHSGSAKIGDVVFCFFNDGKVYHLGTCSAVDKYYVEMEKKDAESRGYSACGSCGG